MTDEARWRSIELMLHDTTINSHSRVAGLFLLLFAWPMNGVLRTTHDQITRLSAGRVLVTFDKVPIELPPVVGPIVFDHMNNHGPASYRVGETAWLFPGRQPGRPIVTEAIRRVLVGHGIHPRASYLFAWFTWFTLVQALPKIGIQAPKKRRIEPH